MVMHSMDPGMVEGIARAAGHPPPFNEGDLAAVRELHVKYAVRMSELSNLGSLRIAILVGCDPVRIEDLHNAPKLRTLIVQDSGLVSLDGIGGVPMVKLSLPRNLLEDVVPLLDIEQPCEIDITGNPLSENSYKEVVPELSRKGHRVKVSGELPWSVTRRLNAEGVPVCCYLSTQGYRLSRPGLALTEFPDYNHPVVTVEQVRELLVADPRRAYEYFEQPKLVPKFLAP
ncbi:hypothetical protein [Streptomyces hydrogenans]|uniref:hypothetical protein n=1 Tax=Streptomyces hydrogenans TaxID=1873719 RepID=UPI0033A77F72